MISLQLVALALLILAYDGYAPTDPVRGSPALIVAAVVASHATLMLAVWARARWAQRQMQRRLLDSHGVAYAMERTLSAARWATVVLAAWQLWGLGWGELVWSPAGWNLARYPLAAEGMVFLPAFLTWIGFWMAYYPVDRAIRERAFAYRLQLGLPVHEMPAFWPYLSMHVRHGFFLVVPLAAGKLAEEWAGRYDGWGSYVVVAVGFLGMLIAIPWIITRIWRTTPMLGSLRGRLVTLARFHRVGFSDVLIWQTYHQVNNAAILGFLPFSRYFLMTDALLETLGDRQIEAVFAHEVGHAKHRHLWWYFAVFGAGGALTVWLSNQIIHLAQAHGVTLSEQSKDHWGIWLQLVLLGLFLMFVFSWISRRFEHQADWFAARHMAGSLENEPAPAPKAGVEEFLGQGALADAGAFAPPMPTALLLQGRGQISPNGEGKSTLVSGARGKDDLQRGAATFTSALETLVRLSHRALNRGGWLHPSPRERAALLYRLARSPQAVKQFERQMFWIRVMIAALALVSVALAPTFFQS